MKLSAEEPASVIDGIDKRILRRILIIAASQLTDAQRCAVMGGFETVIEGLDGKPDPFGRVPNFKWARGKTPEEIFARLLSWYLPDNQPLRALLVKKQREKRERAARRRR